jgi:hypothetical protein
MDEYEKKVFVLDANKMPLQPTHPARARLLLNEDDAAVYRVYSFTITLKYTVDDPASRIASEESIRAAAPRA